MKHMSQLGLLFPIYGKYKSHVPNHQADNIRMAPALSTPHPLVNPDQTRGNSTIFRHTLCPEKNIIPKYPNYIKKTHHRQRNILQFRLI